jgi:septum formation protein
MRFFLASTSPRRREILLNLGLDVTIVPTRHAEAEAPPLPMPPEALAVHHAREKLRQAELPAGEGVAIAADTLVFIDGAVLGKPAGAADARRMIEALAGRTHQVVTAVCLRDLATGRTVDGHTVSRVEFEPLPPRTIDAYIGWHEWTDKAGAYGIQGRAALFIRRIGGCYFNVVGFPVNLFYDLLQQLTGGDETTLLESMFTHERRTDA